MRVGDVLFCRILFPFFLLVAAVCRINVVSFIYLASFLAINVWSPHPFSVKRRLFYEINTAVIGALSFLVCIGHVVFLITFSVHSTSEWLEDSHEWVETLFHNLGWQPANYFSSHKIWNNIRTIAPDFIVFFSAAALFTLFRCKKVLQKVSVEDELENVDEIEEVTLKRRIHSLLTFTCAGLVALCVPSIWNFAYLFLFLAMLLFITFRKSIVDLYYSIWRILLFFCVVHILMLYVMQFPYIFDATPTFVRGVLGVYCWEQYDSWDILGDELWPTLLGLIALSTCFLLVCEWYNIISLEIASEADLRRQLIYNLRLNSRHNNKSSQHHRRNRAITRRSVILNVSSKLKETFSKFRSIRNFFIHYSYWIVLAGFLVVSLLEASLLSLPFLLAACVGALIPAKYAIRGTIPMQLYALVYISLQYAFNIKLEETTDKPILTSVGLINYDTAFPHLGLLALLIIGIALMWHVELYKYVMTDWNAPEFPMRQIQSAEREENLPLLSEEDSKSNTETSLPTHNPVTTTSGWVSRFYGETMTTIYHLIKILWRTLLNQSYKFALAGLWVCCLTRINLLNAGYMLFFVVFIISEAIARKAWLLLLIYTEAVMAILYTWQVTKEWTQEVHDRWTFATELIGLEFYSTVWIGLFWHVLILVFTLIQYELLKIRARHQNDEGLIDEYRKRAHEQSWLSNFFAFILFVKATVEANFLIVSYITILLVGVLTSPSVVNLIYVTFIFLCFILHLILPSAQAYVKRIWPFVVLLSAGLLAARYIYQFPQLSEVIENNFKSIIGLQLQDIGLETFEVSRIFLLILPNAAVLVICVIQARLFYQCDNENIKFTKHERRRFLWLDLWHRLVQFGKRFLILHAHHLTLFVIYFVAVSRVHLIHFAFLGFAVVGVFLPYGTDVVSLPLMLICQLNVLAQTTFRFSKFAGKNDTTAHWIGLNHDLASWDVIEGSIYIILALLLQRYSRRLKLADMKKSEERGDMEWVCTLFRHHPSPAADHRHLNLKTLVNNFKWYASNIISLHGEIVFGGCLVITTFVRNDALSLVFLSLVSLSILSHRMKRILLNGLPFFSGILSSLLISQYGFLMSWAPFTGIKEWPWGSWDDDVTNWLSLSKPSAFLLTGDFVTLFISVRLLFAAPAREMPIQGNTYDYDFTQIPRSWNDQLKYLCLRYSDKVILVLIFILGTYTETALTFGFVACSLVLLYIGDRLLHKGNSYWRWAILVNLVVLFAQLLYSMPFISTDGGDDSYQENLGLKKLDYNNAFTTDGVLMELIILALLCIQKWLYGMHTEMLLVMGFVHTQRELMSRREKVAEEVIEQHVNQALLALKQEHQKSIHRLTLLKKRREAGVGLILAPSDTDTTTPLLETNITTTNPTTPTTERKDDKEDGIPPSSLLVEEEYDHQEEEEDEDEEEGLNVREYIGELWEKTKEGWNYGILLLLKYSLLAIIYLNKGLDYMNNEKYTAAIQKRLEEVGLKEERFHWRLRKPEEEEAEGDHGCLIEYNGELSFIEVTEKEANEHHPPILQDAEDEGEGSSTHSSEENDEKSESEDTTPTPTTPSTTQNPDEGEEGEDQSHTTAIAEGENTTTVPSMMDAIDTNQNGDEQEGVDSIQKEGKQEDTPKEEKDSIQQKEEEEGGEGTNNHVDPKDWDAWKDALLHLRLGIERLLMHNTHLICYFFLVINHTYYASITSLFFPISLFAYAALEFPYPAKHYWRIILAYVTLLLLTKFMFQFPIFCICSGVKGESYQYQPYCHTRPCSEPSEVPADLGLSHMIGIIKTSGWFLSACVMDLALLLSVLWHRYMLKAKGCWDTVGDLEEEYKMHRARQREWQAWVKSDKETRKELQNTKEKEKEKEKETEKEKEKEKEDTPFKKRRERKARSKIGFSMWSKQKREDRKTSKESSTHSSPIRRRKGKPSNHPSSTSSDSENEDKGASSLFPPRRSISIDGDIEVENSADITDLMQATEEHIVQEVSGAYAKVSAKFQFVKWFYRQTILYFKLLAVTTAPDKDYYSQILIVQLTSFFYLIFCQQGFTGIQFTDAITLITQSSIPQSYVMMLFSQFLLIIADRVIYSLQALKTKIVLHYCLVIVLHYLLFFYFPQTNELPFNKTWSLWVFYLLQCVYLYASAMQIRYGYPIFDQGRSLTKTKEPSAIRTWIFLGYRAIPFIFEMNAILDWCVYTTALDFPSWLKFEDIYGSLFEVRCNIAGQKRDNRRLGDKQPLSHKIIIGVVLFTLLCAVIWFPLLLLAEGGIGNIVNQVEESRASIGIVGWTPFFSTYESQNISFVNSEQFSTLRKHFGFILPDDKATSQITSFDEYAEKYWDITQESFNALIDSLKNPSANIALQFEYKFTRLVPQDSPSTMGSATVRLNQTQREQFLSMLQSNDLGNSSIDIPSFYPRLLRLPVYQAITVPSGDEKVGVRLTLLRKIIEENYTTGGEEKTVHRLVLLWTAQQLASTRTALDELFPAEEGPQIVTISTEVPKDALTQSIATAGIIGLYVGVVLSIGRFLRLYVANMMGKIIYEELPSVDQLTAMCDDIFTARKYGDLVLEEGLYRELIEIYRNPQRIIEITAKEKID